MTYQEHLDSLIAPIHSFFSWFSTSINSLLDNYIIRDILGFLIISSALFFVIDLFLHFIQKKNEDLEKKQARYNSYALFQEAKNEFIRKNPSLYYENKYKDYVFQKSVQEDYRRNLLGNVEKNNTEQDKVFSHWKDKSNGTPLTPH